MDDPKLSPFALTPARIVLLALGALLVLIAISTAMGGMSSYQELKEASSAAVDVGPNATPAPEAPAQ